MYEVPPSAMMMHREKVVDELQATRPGVQSPERSVTADMALEVVGG